MDKLSIKSSVIQTESVNFVDADNQFYGIISSNGSQLTVNNAPQGEVQNPLPVFTPTIVPPQIETTTMNFVDENGELSGVITVKDGHLFINDVLQGSNDTVTPANLNNGAVITKEIETNVLTISNTDGNVVGSINAQNGKLYVNGNQQESVYGAYVENALFRVSPSIDSNGNTWLSGNFVDRTKPVSLYNKYNELVQTLQPNTLSGIGNSFVAHISSDGFSNCWIAKIEDRGINATVAPNQFSFIDSQGNFILFQGFSTSITFYDKNGDSFGALTGGASLSTFVCKYSPTGIFTPINGNVLDPNMWCAKIEALSTSSAIIQCVPFITILDKKDNIIICSQAQSAKFIDVYDKKNILIDRITLGAIQSSTVIVKYASNGMKEDKNSQRISWSAHLQASQGSVFAITTYQPIAINSKNDIIITGRYRNLTSTPTVKAFTYDGQIGLDMPFSGLGTTQDIFILSLNENGLSSQSWRNTITSPGLIEDSNFAAIDSDDNIIISARSAGSGSIQVNINNKDNTAAFNYTSAIKNICVVKYLPDGTPINYNTLRATDFIIGAVGNGSPTINDNYGGLFLDSNNNIIIKGIYNGTSLDLFDNTNTDVKTVTRSGTVSGIGFLMKLDSNMENPYLTTFGSGSAGVTPFTGNMFPAFLNITSTDEIVVTGFYIGPDVVFYNDGESTPSLSFVKGSVGALGEPAYNGFVAKYDTSLQNCKVARFISNDRINPVIPQLATLDSEDSSIAYVRYGSTTQSAIGMDIFNFGNTSYIADVTLQNAGSRDMALIKIAVDPSKSWNARISGIDQDVGNFDTQELLKYSSINTDKYNNIYVTGISVKGCTYYDSDDLPRYEIVSDLECNYSARYPAKGF